MSPSFDLRSMMTPSAAATGAMPLQTDPLLLATDLRAGATALERTLAIIASGGGASSSGGNRNGSDSAMGNRSVDSGTPDPVLHANAGLYDPVHHQLPEASSSSAEPLAPLTARAAAKEKGRRKAAIDMNNQAYLDIRAEKEATRKANALARSIAASQALTTVNIDDDEPLSSDGNYTTSSPTIIILLEC
jgi:hypothetical protein